MAVQIIHRVQLIPAPLEKVWAFFVDPANLPRITPPNMQFVVLSPSRGDRIYAGELIEYKLRPLPWLRTRWLTEITQVEEGHYFVDEQRRGPYDLWHHQHHFRKIEGGVEMTDLVHYSVPLGPLGDLANAFFVRRRLEEVFLYRRQQVEAIFGKFPDHSGPLTMRAAPTPRH
jgi:ligand-binding SRPBCC domain-containing protein